MNGPHFSIEIIALEIEPVLMTDQPRLIDHLRFVGLLVYRNFIVSTDLSSKSVYLYFCRTSGAVGVAPLPKQKLCQNKYLIFHLLNFINFFNIIT